MYGIDLAHLSGPYAHNHLILGENDGAAFDMFANDPG